MTTAIYSGSADVEEFSPALSCTVGKCAKPKASNPTDIK